MSGILSNNGALCIILLNAVVLLSGCSGNENKYCITGNDISERDRGSGIIQESPGTEKPEVKGGMTVVDDADSLLRFKMFDDPIKNSQTHGMAKIAAVTSGIDSALMGFNRYGFNGEDITIELSVAKVTAVKKRTSKHEKLKDLISIYYPSADEGRIFFNEARIHTQIVNGMPLAPGIYSSLTIHFSKNGKLYAGNEVFDVKLGNDSVYYLKDFLVEKGRITTLRIISIKDKIREILSTIIHKDHFQCRQQYEFRTRRKNSRPIHLNVRHFLPIDSYIHDPISKVFIKITRVSAVKENDDLLTLNEKETEFELLSLRGGAVALMGQNAVLAGKYKYFDLSLGSGHSVVVDGQIFPLTIENWAYDSLRFMGPFDLRGGRITEVFVHFDPNRSIFYDGKGFIMEPDAAITSVISMTPEQELRIVKSLGALSNTVMSQAEIAFQGVVKSITSLAANNMHGKKMIYSDVVLDVEDRLRGNLDIAVKYSLRIIGGSHNGIKLTVPGMPGFRADENVLLFLKDYNGRMSVVHGEFGKINMK